MCVCDEQLHCILLLCLSIKPLALSDVPAFLGVVVVVLLLLLLGLLLLLLLLVGRKALVPEAQAGRPGGRGR